MADRLQELLQQRALIKEHLAWIEGEIAAASGRAPAFPPVAPAHAANAPVPNPVVAASPSARLKEFAPAAAQPAAGNMDADALLAKLAAEESRMQPPNKMGCWMIFVAALVLFLGAAIGLFYIFRR